MVLQPGSIPEQFWAHSHASPLVRCHKLHVIKCRRCRAHQGNRHRRAADIQHRNVLCATRLEAVCGFLRRLVQVLVGVVTTVVRQCTAVRAGFRRHLQEEGDILTATERGYGKRTRVDEHSPQGRGGQGVIGIQTSERNGALVSALQVADENDIMLISDGGTLVRTHTDEISTLGRNTQGVTLIRLAEDEKLVGLARIESEDDEEDAEEE